MTDGIFGLKGMIVSPSHSAPAFIDGPIAVIGDVHGQLNLLYRLLDRIAAYDGAAFDQRTIVFVGDFVDRGPDPAGVVRFVREQIQSSRKMTACMGNHEIAFLGALNAIPTVPMTDWGIRYVGYYSAFTTFTSYGVAVRERDFNELSSFAQDCAPYYNPIDEQFGKSMPDELQVLEHFRIQPLIQELRDAVPPEDREFLAGLPWVIRHPEALIVHAGLEPEPLAMQISHLTERDFLIHGGRPSWLFERRLAFLPAPTDCPYLVVSGHVVVPQVTIKPEDRRILIDTSGGLGPPLSAILLPEGVVVMSD